MNIQQKEKIEMIVMESSLQEADKDQLYTIVSARIVNELFDGDTSLKESAIFKEIMKFVDNLFTKLI